MKNTFGTGISVTLFGESHGEAIGAVLDGLAPGISVDEEFIAKRLFLRRPSGKIGTARREEDKFKILSGVFNGKTTGTPLCIIIPNENTVSRDYDEIKNLARPGHADYAANIKYHGFEDHRGGGHFSGRITAALVAAGAIALLALKSKGIDIGTHIKALGEVKDREFRDYTEDIARLNESVFAVLDGNAAAAMEKEIEKSAEAGDSIGGILETAVTGTDAGVGEPWFDTVEGVVSHAVFSVPGVKGIELGIGFEGIKLRGSEYNDPFYTENGKIYTKTNNNGGINGGITNGMPIIFRTAIKPTPSVYKEQETVDMAKKENAVIKISGRHDPAIIHRARAVIDSVTALALCDLLAQRYGTDYFGGAK